jgi:pyruvate kinase
MTSHAATLGLRLGIPVILGVKDATQKIREGAIVTVDAERGMIYSGAIASSSINSGTIKLPIP